MRTVLRQYALAAAAGAETQESSDAAASGAAAAQIRSLRYRDNSIHIQDKLTAHGSKGWATALLSHGSNSGAYYFELTIEEDGGGLTEMPLTRRKSQQQQPAVPPAAAVRVGWSLRYSRLDTPLGMDNFSFSLRDRDGSVVFNAKRRPYAQQTVRAGDIVGCALLQAAVPKGGCADPRLRPELHSFVQAGLLCNPKRPPATQQHPTACVIYTINGQTLAPPALLGELPAGCWHPGVSLFGPARAKFNLGPNFEFAPPLIPPELQEASGCSHFAPAAELPYPPF